MGFDAMGVDQPAKQAMPTPVQLRPQCNAADPRLPAPERVSRQGAGTRFDGHLRFRMEFDVNKDQWVERFALHLAFLEPGTETDTFRDLAHDLWNRWGHLPPEQVAEARHESRLDDKP